MKTLFLCTLVLSLATNLSSTTPLSIQQQQSVLSTTFDAGTVMQLLEEYTHVTRTEPQNISEEQTISELIAGLSTQSSRIEEEIRNNKLAHNGLTPKNIENKLRQYQESVRTALKELHKRQNRVRVLAQNLLRHDRDITHFAFHEQNTLSTRTFSPSQRLRDSLLQSPLLSTC